MSGTAGLGSPKPRLQSQPAGQSNPEPFSFSFSLFGEQKFGHRSLDLPVFVHLGARAAVRSVPSVPLVCRLPRSAAARLLDSLPSSHARLPWRVPADGPRRPVFTSCAYLGSYVRLTRPPFPPPRQRVPNSAGVGGLRIGSVPGVGSEGTSISYTTRAISRCPDWVVELPAPSSYTFPSHTSRARCIASSRYSGPYDQGGYHASLLA